MSPIEIVNEILFWILLYILAWYGHTLFFNRGVPNFRTIPALRQTIIGILKKDSKRRPKTPYTIIDLGSGNGQLTRQIARSMPEARVIGIEISPKSYLWAVMLRRFFKLENLEYKRLDFYSHDSSGADAVVLYLTAYEMERMGKKLHKELKTGTLVISNKFRLGDGWEPSETIDVKTLYPHQKRLHVYYKQ